MSIFSAFQISGSGLNAQRVRLETIMSNLANAATTRTPEGGPYRRKDVVLTAENVGDFEQYLQGVSVEDVVTDPSPFVRKYDPAHPDADANGYVFFPNVDPTEEMANLVAAGRSFEANVAAMNALKDMMNRAIDLGR